VQRPEINVTQRGVYWPDPVSGPWYLAAHWVDHEGRAECIGLEIWRGAEPNSSSGNHEQFESARTWRGIGGTDLRQFPLASLLRDLWANQVAYAEPGEAILNSPNPEVMELFQNFTKGVRTAKFGDRGIAASEDVAAVYQEALRQRRPPTKTVAEVFSVSHSTATKWVKRARDEGHLPKTEPGRPSPLPTPKKKGRKK
jgi:hypothetical protein